MRSLFILLALACAALAQTPPKLAAIRDTPIAPVEPGENTFTPTWETQKQARTWLLSLPAPRGQITDRNGSPLAQTRVSYNLAIAFPTPLRFGERDLTRFAQTQVLLARTLLGRSVEINPTLAIKHYKNRGVLPLVIAQDLKPVELEAYHRDKPEHLVLQAVYQRFYPNGNLAGHIVGYAGRSGRTPDGPVENNELLWPNSEGREGLEQFFDQQLQGKMGQWNVSFDAQGRKAAEQVSIPPQPGYNVVTTLDENLQRLCEQALEKGTKRGAIVIIDPNTGDILAMASWPTINPNQFVPAISTEDFKALQDDPNIPLLPRAYRAAYPPGSVFKCFVGLAALGSGKITPEDEFSCPASYEIGNLTFRNWKKEGAGMLNFADALTQSCNTWFYQVGMRLGSKPVFDYSTRLGLGQKTGIPLNAEVEGRVMNDEYMQKVYKRRMQGGDLANLAIGQGDTLISPLQMAQAMGALGNGGTLYQTRLVQQVQSIDGQIVTANTVRARGVVEIDNETMKTVRRGMIQVVEGRLGTAGKAAVPRVQVAGKTGTAQWGPKNNERTAAWFAGFAPAENPRYAFAALYEGDANNDDVHGGTQAAPLIGKVLREVFKNEPKDIGKGKKRKKGDSEDPNAEPADGEEVMEEEEAPTRRSPRRARPDEDDLSPPPAARPAPRSNGTGQPFWKRWFR